MFLLKRFFCILCVLQFGQLLHAQKGIADSVYVLNEVVVNTCRYQSMATGATVRRIDTLLMQASQSQTLSDVLFQQGGITVTSYGQGGLSGASVRGSASNHTAVVWNDMNLQSPMNGGFNLSVLPVFLIGNIAVQYGGSGVAYGSGAMSGTIHLGNETLFGTQNHVTLNVGMGSFGNKTISGGGIFHHQKYATALKVFTQQADNDFIFKVLTPGGLKSVNQTNAGVNQYGILQENQLNYNDHIVLKASVWYQHYDKDLQTRMSAPEDNTNQKDNNIIFNSSWKYLTSSASVTIKGGIIYNQVLYRGVFSDISNNSATSDVGEIEYKKTINVHLALHSGINNTFETAHATRYLKSESRNRTSVYSTIKTHLAANKLHVLLGIRDEAVNLAPQPAVFSVGTEMEPSQMLQLKATVSTNYKLPTFNDLYWLDAYDKGNPDLLPESGWSADAGYKIETKGSGVGFFLSNSIYYSKIKNWIVWEPDSSKIWTPNNRELGVSYGTEIHAEVSLNAGFSVFTIKNDYTYNISKIVKTERTKVAMPLLYNPAHHEVLSLGATLKRCTVYYIENFFSVRYTDHSQGTLPAYYVADVSIVFTSKVLKNATNLSFRINNIWNTQYQIRRDYAMPMRNFMIALSFNVAGKN